MIEIYQIWPGIAPNLIINDPWANSKEKLVLEETNRRLKTIAIEAAAWIIKYFIILFLPAKEEHRIDRNKIVLISIINHIFKSDVLDRAVEIENNSSKYR